MPSWFKLMNLPITLYLSDFPGGSAVKKQPANAGDEETWVWSLGREDPLEKEMVTHSNILAWEILWTKKPSGL